MDSAHATSDRNHATRDRNCTVKLKPSLHRKYIWHNQKRKKHSVCTNKKSTPQNTTTGPTFLEKLPSDTFQEWGFKINKCYLYVTDKTINVNQ